MHWYLWIQDDRFLWIGAPFWSTVEVHCPISNAMKMPCRFTSNPGPCVHELARHEDESPCWIPRRAHSMKKILGNSSTRTQVVLHRYPLDLGNTKYILPSTWPIHLLLLEVSLTCRNIEQNHRKQNLLPSPTVNILELCSCRLRIRYLNWPEIGGGFHRRNYEQLHKSKQFPCVPAPLAWMLVTSPMEFSYSNDEELYSMSTHASSIGSASSSERMACNILSSDGQFQDFLKTFSQNGRTYDLDLSSFLAVNWNQLEHKILSKFEPISWLPAQLSTDSWSRHCFQELTSKDPNMVEPCLLLLLL